MKVGNKAIGLSLMVLSSFQKRVVPAFEGHFPATSSLGGEQTPTAPVGDSHSLPLPSWISYAGASLRSALTLSRGKASSLCLSSTCSHGLSWFSDLLSHLPMVVPSLELGSDPWAPPLRGVGSVTWCELFDRGAGHLLFYLFPSLFRTICNFDRVLPHLRNTTFHRDSHRFMTDSPIFVMTARQCVNLTHITSKVFASFPCPGRVSPFHNQLHTYPIKLSGKGKETLLTFPAFAFLSSCLSFL